MVGDVVVIEEVCKHERPDVFMSGSATARLMWSSLPKPPAGGWSRRFRHKGSVVRGSSLVDLGPGSAVLMKAGSLGRQEASRSGVVMW